MEKNNDSWLLRQIAIIIALTEAFLYSVTTEYHHKPLVIFSLILILLMVIISWKEEEDDENNTSPFFFRIIIVFLLMFSSLLSLLGFAFSEETFNDFWSQIFGWPSFIWSLLITIYSLAMLEKEWKEKYKKQLDKYSGMMLIMVLIIVMMINGQKIIS